MKEDDRKEIKQQERKKMEDHERKADKGAEKRKRRHGEVDVMHLMSRRDMSCS